LKEEWVDGELPTEVLALVNAVFSESPLASWMLIAEAYMKLTQKLDWSPK